MILDFRLLQPFLTSHFTLYKSSISSVMRKSCCLNLSKTQNLLPSSLFSFSNSLIVNWSCEYILFYKLFLFMDTYSIMLLCWAFKTCTSNSFFSFQELMFLLWLRGIRSTERQEKFNCYITTCFKATLVFQLMSPNLSTIFTTTKRTVSSLWI